MSELHLVVYLSAGLYDAKSPENLAFYFAALFLGLFIVLPCFGAWGVRICEDNWWSMVHDYALSFSLFLGNLSFVKKIGVVSPVFGLLWSVCIEEQFYLIWGACMRWILRA